MEQMAVPLGTPDQDDLRYLKEFLQEGWRNQLMALEGPIAAGETVNYHETRNPYKQTASYASVSLAATSVSVLPITTQIIGSSLQFAPGYWDLGKKVHCRMFGQMTTGATPGNLTVEVRHQTGATPTDAGGTILQTSGAVALTATKTGISWFCDFTIEARAQIGTAAALFAKGWFTSDNASTLIPAASNPMMIPAASAAQVNVDTTLASTIMLQMKRSGSTAEAVVVHDFQVNSLT